MDLERRVLALEEESLDRLAAEFAIDKMIRSIIATHPDPKSLKVLFETQLQELESLMADKGFDQGAPAEHSADLVRRIRGLANGWLEVIDRSQTSE